MGHSMSSYQSKNEMDTNHLYSCQFFGYMHIIMIVTTYVNYSPISLTVLEILLFQFYPYFGPKLLLAAILNRAKLEIVTIFLINWIEATQNHWKFAFCHFDIQRVQKLHLKVHTNNTAWAMWLWKLNKKNLTSAKN